MQIDHVHILAFPQHFPSTKHLGVGEGGGGVLQPRSRHQTGPDWDPYGEGLTDGQGLLRLPHGRPDDVGAVDALLVPELLGFVEPFSGHVPQQVPVAHRPLQVPAHTAEAKSAPRSSEDSGVEEALGYVATLWLEPVGTWWCLWCGCVVLSSLTGCAAPRPSSAPRLSSARPG